MAASFLLKEDGGHLLLEDASGALLLEESVGPSPVTQINVGGVVRPRAVPQPSALEDDDAIAMSLLLLGD